MKQLATTVIKLASALISRPSLTPEDSGCQEILAECLKALGFTITPLRFGEVSNLWARRGSEGPLLVFAGHTDVVPPGPLSHWHTPPFSPQIRNGFLYGRGAADMKGAIAAMVGACEQFIRAHGDHAGSIAFLITSDEEGDAIDGTQKVVQWLQENHIQPDYCIVGEASSDIKTGDMIKIGRRGSLSASLTVHGKQGHVAYPDRASNPIHRALAALQELTTIEWDNGSEHFPPTSLQISNIHSGTGANNVIPGELSCAFNFRYSPALSADIIKAQVEKLFSRHQLQFALEWHHSGEPFFTGRSEFSQAVCESIFAVTGLYTKLSTSGGTSDGRFIAKLCDVIELGVPNATIHQINECVAVDDLVTLATLYESILTRLLLQKSSHREVNPARQISTD